MKLEDSVYSHYKIEFLAEELGIESVYALGHMTALWVYALNNRPDGDLDGWGDKEIAFAAKWKGDPAKFVQSCMNVGLLDVDRKLHNFLRRAGSHREAQRMAKWRAEQKEVDRNVTVPNGNVDVQNCNVTTRNSNVTVTAQSCNNTVRGEERSREEKSGADKNTMSSSKNEPDSFFLERAEKGIITQPPGEDGAEDIRAVFLHYRTYHREAHKKPTSDSKEWKHIKARLAEGCTVEDLRLAIDGCHRSAWHQGKNKRSRRYDSLELIMRTGSKVQQFMELNNPTPLEGMSDLTKHNLDAGMRWVEGKKNAGK